MKQQTHRRQNGQVDMDLKTNRDALLERRPKESHGARDKQKTQDTERMKGKFSTRN